MNFIECSHHIIQDATCSVTIMNEITANYNRLIISKGTTLVTEVKTCSQAIQSESNLLTLPYKNRSRDFWLDFIADLPTNIQLPYKSWAIPKNLNNKIGDKSGEFIYFELDKEESILLRSYAKKHGSTLFLTLAALYALVVAKYSNQENIIINYPVDMRPKGYSNVTGSFVNNVLLKLELAKYNTLEELIVGLTLQRKEVKLHQAYSLTNIIEDQQKINHSKINNYFNVGFTQTNLNSGSLLTLEQVDVIPVDMPWSSQVVNELGLQYDDKSNSIIKFKLEYQKELLDNTLINSFICSFKALILKVIDQPTLVLDNYCVLNNDEYQKIVYSWNQTDINYPINQTIHQLFEYQVQKNPLRTAVVYEGNTLSYLELNEKANQIARYMQLHSVSFGDLVGVFAVRSADFLASMMAIWKLGAIYIPLDPSYPLKRTLEILSQSQVRYLLTEQNQLCHLQVETQQELKIMLMEDINESNYDTTNLNITYPLDHLAYIIYTSGSTGTPKGAMLEHLGMLNHLYAKIGALSFSENDCMVQNASQSFDISIWQFLIALVVGAKLCIYSDKVVREPFLLTQKIADDDVTIIEIVPSLLSLILEDSTNWQQGFTDKLRWLILTGEALPVNLARKWLNMFPKIPLLNAYGPTECSDDVTHYPIFNESDLNSLNTPIGKPVANMKTYILDGYLQPVPIGVIGELYIGGCGVGRGYLNSQEKTKVHFMKNPFLDKNSRLYKTGDLARWLPDGNIEYIGREDFQAKIRGFRVELGEIENKLLTFTGIKQAVVKNIQLSNEENNESSCLVGYYVSDSKIEEEEILQYLATILPEYMIPNALVYMAHLPLTLNGKIDQKALPVPKFTSLNNYVEPSSELEHKMSQIWAEVLGLSADKIGINTNFFRLGGNSLLAIKLVSKVNKVLFGAAKLRVTDIFKQDTVAKLVNYLANPDEDIPEILGYEVPTEKQALSFAQERLWFIEQYEGGSNAYNIPLVFKLAGDTDINALEQSIRKVVTRHNILRTIIKVGANGDGYQLVLDDTLQPLPILNHAIYNYEELLLTIKKEVNHIYDLSREYPIRVSIYKYSFNDSTEDYLSIVIHHIAFDGWSIDIFLRELHEYYSYFIASQVAGGVPFNLMPLSIQYKDFALWQRNYLSGNRLIKQISYWREKLTGYEPLNLITDKPRPMKLDYEGSDVYFLVDSNTTEQLRNLAKECSISLYSLLLGCYYLMLRNYTNQDDLVVGTPVANRHYQQIGDLIGFFVNSLALRCVVDPEDSVKSFFKTIGNEVISAQLHQDLPFEKLVQELNIVQDPSRHPIFQVMFGVQGFTSNLSSDILLPYTADIGYKVAKFDITTMIDDSSSELKGVFNYATSLYCQETIQRYIDTYLVILKQVANLNQRDCKIAELDYLSQDVYYKVVHSWNSSVLEYSQDKIMLSLFEDIAANTPNNTAVIEHDGLSYTYQDLQLDSKLLAKYLIGNSGKLIAILSEKGYRQVISALAIMRSRHGYLPLNVDWPVQRISEVLEMGQVQVVLISKAQSLNKELYQTLVNNYQLIIIEDILTQLRNDRELLLGLDSIKLPIVKPSDIAYVIFTSGSTGKPKGVTISHRGVLNTIYAVNEEFKVRSSDKTLALSELSFDLSVYDIFGMLIVGGTVVFPMQEKTKDPTHWLSLLFTYGITIWNTVPQLADLLMDSIVADCSHNLDSLRLFLLSGDWVSVQLPDKIRKVCDDAEVISLGGATEGSIWSIWYKVNAVDLRWKSIPYGRAMPNQKMYILNKSLRASHIGAIGEIYIGGMGIALNYWNDAQKTNNSFIEHPDFGRIYRTGDCGYWNSKGYIEFAGRNDFQVKINGYRVELGEIEGVLNNYPEINQSVVLAVNNIDASNKSMTDKYLVAYYVAKNSLSEEAILNYLMPRLPEYMLPKVLVHLECLPLTINGKLDRDKLPEPGFISNEIYQAPRSEVEIMVCNVYAEILSLEPSKIGIWDDFFRLGGNSILAIKLVNKLNNVIFKDSRINVADIVRHKTIQALLSNSSNGIKPTTYDQGEF